MHVVNGLDYGGVERHMAVLAEHLDSARLRHVFVALDQGGAAAESMRALGADVTCLGRESRIPSISAWCALWREIRRVRPDIVHTHGAEANFHGLLAAAAAGVPVRVAEEIGIPGHSRVARRVFRQVYRLATAVIGVSAVVTHWLCSSGEVDERRSVTLENPVKLPAPAAARGSHRDDRLRIACVGRLEPVKNPAGLLAAFAALPPDCGAAELWFIGDGSQRAALETTARARGLAGRVRFLGFQPSPEVLLRQCDLVVQPSLAEGFGIALVEAMACGLPVISTRVGIAPQLITAGEQGWLVVEPTAQCLGEALRLALRLSPRERLEMGLRARAAVVGRFQPERYLHRLETLYRRLRPGLEAA
jgi:glycosyltransferase involved in cell wall biosynthesis